MNSRIQIIIIIVTMISSLACVARKFTEDIFTEKIYLTNANHIYARSRLTLSVDRTFVYAEGGPSIFLSKGTWKFSPKGREITLSSGKTDVKYLYPRLDTVWTSISGEIAKVTSETEILFRNMIFYRQ